uniref:Uncharacterized protein n=1 Tax=Setaria italica TaxID=4555 RepID=K4A4I8_SETIT
MLVAPYLEDQVLSEHSEELPQASTSVLGSKNR